MSASLTKGKNQTILHPTIDTSLALAGPSGIRAGWGIETNGRFEAERPPTLAGPPSGGRAATLTPFSPMYSTRILLSSLSYNPACVPGPSFFPRNSLAL